MSQTMELKKAPARFILGGWDNGAPEGAILFPRDSKRARMFFSFLRREGFTTRGFTQDTTRGRRLDRKMRGITPGYGHENDVFLLRVYDWDSQCGCGLNDRYDAWLKANVHGSDCYQSRIKELEEKVQDEYGGQQLHELAPLERYRQARQRMDTLITELALAMGLDPSYGRLVHCTCHHDNLERKTFQGQLHATNCRYIQPNFVHKPSDFRLYWYKYPLRSAMSSRPCNHKEFAKILADCHMSIKRM